MDALDDALRVIASLNDAGVDYVVVGGVALNIHGLVRATEDLLFVRPDAANIERLRQALRAVWSDPDIEQITAEDLCGAYPAVRYGPPEGTVYLDILTRLGETTRFSDLRVEEKEIEGVRVRVATPGTLYRMKRNTGATHRQGGRSGVALGIRAEGRRLSNMPVRKYRSAADMPPSRTRERRPCRVTHPRALGARVRTLPRFAAPRREALPLDRGGECGSRADDFGTDETAVGLAARLNF